MFSDLEVQQAVVRLLGVAAIVLGSAQASADVTVEKADVIGQGMAGSGTGLTASIRIPTPTMGSYEYPPGNAFNPDAVPGHPEVFSFWVFVFNYPEQCATPNACDLGDFMAGRGAPAAFNAGGHVVGYAPYLQLSGHVSFNSKPFLPPGGRLIEPETAEVHLAIAPHGALVSEFMPQQIQTPIGSLDHWWMAFF